MSGFSLDAIISLSASDRLEPAQLERAREMYQQELRREDSSSLREPLIRPREDTDPLLEQLVQPREDLLRQNQELTLQF